MAEIKMVPYSAKYIDTVVEMHNTWNSPVDHLKPQAFPEIGWLAFHITAEGQTPIAAGFLRKVEGGYAQIDTLVSNKTLPGAIRHVGIDKVVKSLIDDAKSLELHGILCLTADVSTIKRALDIGFVIVPQVAIAMSLR